MEKTFPYGYVFLDLVRACSIVSQSICIIKLVAFSNMK